MEGTCGKMLYTCSQLGSKNETSFWSVAGVTLPHMGVAGRGTGGGLLDTGHRGSTVIKLQTKTPDNLNPG